MGPLDNLNTDIRTVLFEGMEELCVTGCISVCTEGIVSGISDAIEKAEEIGLQYLALVDDGMWVEAGDPILAVRGNPMQITNAEELLPGELAKSSGIATAAAQAVALANGQAKIVCGSVKKMPISMKRKIRHAILHGGAEIRIAELPFLYIDKNYIRMFGNTGKAMTAAKKFPAHTVAIQIRDGQEGLESEVEAACARPADILMIDTGKMEHIDRVKQLLFQKDLCQTVKLAFAGNVSMTDIPALLEKEVDIICIGRGIADAPLLDLRFDVIAIDNHPLKDSFGVDLLQKSELWIENITIHEVNLHQIATVVAEILGLPADELLVVDVRPGNLTLDILRQKVDISTIAGKERQILQALGQIEGISIGADTYIHSNGVLGLIGLESSQVPEILNNTKAMIKGVQAVVAKKVCVFPTGFEVRENMIQDTNSPMIREHLQALDYEVKIGPVLPDIQREIALAIDKAAQEGYGLLITTGGVGAEDKDWTIEAVLELDPTAATPWIVKYQKGSGRHVKGGVRIAVGMIGPVMVVSLPGPNDEVKIALDILSGYLQQGNQLDRYELANHIAAALRKRIKKKGGFQH